MRRFARGPYYEYMSVTNRKQGRRRITPIFKSVGSESVGSSPGTPIYIGDREPAEATYSLIQYNQTTASVVTPESLEETILMQDPDMINWINVNGFARQEDYRRLCGYLKLDPLTAEDIVNTKHRPKVEDFGHYLLVIAKMITVRDLGTVEYEQISVILTENAIVTFQETPGTFLDPVRERIKGTGRLRRAGTDYLLYAILDVIVDNYFTVLERLGTQLETFEEESVSARDSRQFMRGMQNLKSELNHLRRILWPVRDSISALLHAETPLLGEALEPFLRDLHENAIQIIEVLDNYRETASGIQDVFLSSLSTRMNEVMKVLTIISTIFIPLTFIAGVYGMNFVHMPEIGAPWGYPAALAGMGVVAGALIVFFKRKKWL